MLDSLLLFLFMTSPVIIFLTWLVLLKRPDRVEIQPKESFTPPPFVREILEKEAERLLISGGYAEIHFDNEDTRPMPASPHDDILDSFDYDELWEAAARIPRESQEEKAKIDRWVNEAIESAGEDFEL